MYSTDMKVCDRCRLLEEKLVHEVALRIYMERAMSVFMMDHPFENLPETEQSKCLEQARNHLMIDLLPGPRPPAEAP
jgi:hypothetical protein